MKGPGFNPSSDAVREFRAALRAAATAGDGLLSFADVRANVRKPNGAALEDGYLRDMLTLLEESGDVLCHRLAVGLRYTVL